MTFGQLFRDVRYMIIFGVVFGLTNTIANGLTYKFESWSGLIVILSFIILSAVYGLILKSYFGTNHFESRAVMAKLAVLSIITSLFITFLGVLFSSFIFMGLRADSSSTYADLLSELYLKPDVLLNILTTAGINSMIMFVALMVGSWLARRGHQPETPTLNPPNNM